MITEHREQQVKLLTARITISLTNTFGDNADLILLGEIIDEANQCHGCESIRDITEIIAAEDRHELVRS